jgi:hypothetical protein
MSSIIKILDALTEDYAEMKVLESVEEWLKKKIVIPTTAVQTLQMAHKIPSLAVYPPSWTQQRDQMDQRDQSEEKDRPFSPINVPCAPKQIVMPKDNSCDCSKTCGSCNSVEDRFNEAVLRTEKTPAQ